MRRTQMPRRRSVSGACLTVPRESAGVRQPAVGRAARARSDPAVDERLAADRCCQRCSMTPGSGRQACCARRPAAVARTVRSRRGGLARRSWGSERTSMYPHRRMPSRSSWCGRAVRVTDRSAPRPRIAGSSTRSAWRPARGRREPAVAGGPVRHPPLELVVGLDDERDQHLGERGGQRQAPGHRAAPVTLLVPGGPGAGHGASSVGSGARDAGGAALRRSRCRSPRRSRAGVASAAGWPAAGRACRCTRPVPGGAISIPGRTADLPAGGWLVRRPHGPGSATRPWPRSPRGRQGPALPSRHRRASRPGHAARRNAQRREPARRAPILAGHGQTQPPPWRRQRGQVGQHPIDLLLEQVGKHALGDPDGGLSGLSRRQKRARKSARRSRRTGMRSQPAKSACSASTGP